MDPTTTIKKSSVSVPKRLEAHRSGEAGRHPRMPVGRGRNEEPSQQKRREEWDTKPTLLPEELAPFTSNNLTHRVSNLVSGYSSFVSTLTSWVGEVSPGGADNPLRLQLRRVSLGCSEGHSASPV